MATHRFEFASTRTADQITARLLHHRHSLAYDRDVTVKLVAEDGFSLAYGSVEVSGALISVPQGTRILLTARPNLTAFYIVVFGMLVGGPAMLVAAFGRNTSLPMLAIVFTGLLSMTAPALLMYWGMQRRFQLEWDEAKAHVRFALQLEEDAIVDADAEAAELLARSEILEISEEHSPGKDHRV